MTGRCDITPGTTMYLDKHVEVLVTSVCVDGATVLPAGSIVRRHVALDRLTEERFND